MLSLLFTFPIFILLLSFSHSSFSIRRQIKMSNATSKSYLLSTVYSTLLNLIGEPSTPAAWMSIFLEDQCRVNMRIVLKRKIWNCSCGINKSVVACCTAEGKIYTSLYSFDLFTSLFIIHMIS